MLTWRHTHVTYHRLRTCTSYTGLVKKKIGDGGGGNIGCGWGVIWVMEGKEVVRVGGGGMVGHSYFYLLDLFQGLYTKDKMTVHVACSEANFIQMMFQTVYLTILAYFGKRKQVTYHLNLSYWYFGILPSVLFFPCRILCINSYPARRYVR